MACIRRIYITCDLVANDTADGDDVDVNIVIRFWTRKKLVALALHLYYSKDVSWQKTPNGLIENRSALSVPISHERIPTYLLFRIAEP